MNGVVNQTTEIYEHVFLKSFSKFTYENISSFSWQVFSVYTRKPGIDMSIPIVCSQVILLIYAIGVTYQNFGETYVIHTELLSASVVNAKIVYTLLFILPVIVIERWIYRRNPVAWREQIFGIKEYRRPHDYKEIDYAIEKR